MVWMSVRLFLLTLVPPSMVLLFVFLIQMRQGRGRLGEEDSDVDIEGFDEDDDGKPKTPAPVSIFTEIPSVVHFVDLHPHSRRLHSAGQVCWVWHLSDNRIHSSD